MASSAAVYSDSSMHVSCPAVAPCDQDTASRVRSGSDANAPQHATIRLIRATPMQLIWHFLLASATLLVSGLQASAQEAVGPTADGVGTALNRLTNVVQSLTDQRRGYVTIVDLNTALSRIADELDSDPCRVVSAIFVVDKLRGHVLSVTLYNAPSRLSTTWTSSGAAMRVSFLTEETGSVLHGDDQRILRSPSFRIGSPTLCNDSTYVRAHARAVKRHACALRTLGERLRLDDLANSLEPAKGAANAARKEADAAHASVNTLLAQLDAVNRLPCPPDFYRCNCPGVHNTDCHRDGYDCGGWPNAIPCADDFRCIRRRAIIESAERAKETAEGANSKSVANQRLVKRIERLRTLGERHATLLRTLYYRELLACEALLGPAGDTRTSRMRTAAKEYRTVLAELRLNPILEEILKACPYPFDPFAQ